jgi:rhodanese-related sulfurtransferase
VHLRAPVFLRLGDHIDLRSVVKQVVAYCRGPYRLMSYDTVQLLHKKGLKARRLENGLPEWRLAGLPIEN